MMSESLFRIDSAVDAAAQIERPRIVDRITAAAVCPITLLVAPAGYGKSVALRQYLGTLDQRSICFSLRSEHATLLGFLGGLAEAFGEKAPHARALLAEAYERNISSPNRGADLAGWMRAHLDSFPGVVGIDDLHVAEADPEVAQFLTSLIEMMKGKSRWILASRSTTGLPVGTWLTYGDAVPAIDEGDLAFTPEEARDAAARLRLTICDDELADILRLTEGWPAATSFALRTSARSADLRSVTATTRKMIYRLLGEQVYAMLDEGERALLEIAVALPSIDLRVLQLAGFDRALTIIERLRERSAFIYEESPRIYRCHDLFRDFLRHQSALNGQRSQQIAHDRAARALEASGDMEHAIASYIAAESCVDVVRLLERHGFDLLERARSDVVTRAVESLDDKSRRENASILALQGSLQATAGKFARAESFFRRALARAGHDGDLRAMTSLRLASVMANQGQDGTTLLLAVGNDPEQSLAHRLEALSLIAGQLAVAGDHEAAREAVAEAQILMAEVELDPVRARALQRIGIAFHHLGMADRAFDVLLQSSELATDLHLYSIACRANAVLSNLALHETDDVAKQLQYAEAAVDAAVKAGDAFGLQTAMLQTLSARMRFGDVEKSVEIERRLDVLKSGELTARYVTLFRSMRLGWEGRFAEAHQLASPSWAQLGFEFDRIFCGSQYALFLACDGQIEKSANVTREMLTLLASTTATGPFRIRSMAIAKAFCALAEAINGRATHADRILRGLSLGGDAVITLVVRAADAIIFLLRYGDGGATDCVGDSIEGLSTLGYTDVTRLLGAVYRMLKCERPEVLRESELTRAELGILRLLASGLVPKEIAERSGRSVYTVRVHIANVIAKLGCHGRVEAIRKAQHMSLI
ncbi:MAG: LuxR C-terminal-related transcriptional regulator [Candidatus Cybelea sp.]